MKNEKINPKERIDTNLKKVTQLSKMLLDSDYENYDSEKIFDMITSAAYTAETTYYFEVRDNE